MKDFAHRCIDAGAHAVVGHGPHLLRPIEMCMDGNEAETGLPKKSCNPEIFEYLRDMCKPYGTQLSLLDDGLFDCNW